VSELENESMTENNEQSEPTAVSSWKWANDINNEPIEDRAYRLGTQAVYPTSEDRFVNSGLSKRELLAALAMQSLVSRIPWPMPDDCSEEMICAQAVVLADALLKGLIT
jgi:hypothetical protein